MKKAISLSLVLGMIILPCLSVSAQKILVPSRESATWEPKRPLRPNSTAANQFERIEATTSGEGVLLQWGMRSETANLGFYIHRVDGNNESVINEQIVFGSVARAGRQPLYGEQYAFMDSFGGRGSRYFIETV